MASDNIPLIIRHLLLVCLLIIPDYSFAQGGTWTWINGSAVLNATGVYGTQGIPSPNNYPPASYEYVDWKDKQGNFWIYGGTYPQKMSDLWKYDPVSNEWTWVKGNGLPNQTATYGIKGVPDPINSPGVRSFGTVSWTDTSGHLWLFGGDKMTSYGNDLWQYNISTNQWTWMSGSSTGSSFATYGIQGVPSPTNVPGSRCEISSGWTDEQNNLWLFGGEGYAAATTGTLNDLFKYDIGSNEWTWMKGSTTTYSATVYGTKGVPATTNDPGGNWSFAKWKDAFGNFWTMGKQKNELWKFDPFTNQWTWMDGSPVLNDPGSYNTYCFWDTLNNPAGRFEQRSNVTDSCGKFWLFGGRTGQVNCDYNDLWIYDPQESKWNWISGTHICGHLGNYGTKGIPDPGNLPPGRNGAVAWWGNDNRFYLFAGTRNQAMADLWVFETDTGCLPPCQNSLTANFSSLNYLCAGTCIDFQNLSIFGSTYQWFFPGANPDTSTATNPDNICYSTGGTYDVTLIATNSADTDTLTISNYITVANPSAAFASSSQTVCSGSCISFSNLSIDASSFQWFFPGATPSSSAQTNPDTICYSSAGIYPVTLIAINNSCVDSITLIDYITVFPDPQNLSIQQSGDTLISNIGFITYQWFYNGDSITGATDYFYIATYSGDYNVICTDSNGCEVEAAIFNVVASVTYLPFRTDSRMILIPNPVNEKLLVQSSSFDMTVKEIRVYNLLGEQVYHSHANPGTVIIDCRLLLGGLYILEVISDDEIYKAKFIKH